jgi:hypothetical protein
MVRPRASLHRQERVKRRHLRECGAKRAVKELDAIDAPFDELGAHFGRDLPRQRDGGSRNLHMPVRDRRRPSAVVVDALTSENRQRHLAPRVLPQVGVGVADQSRIVGPAQTSIRCDEHEPSSSWLLARSQQGMFHLAHGAGQAVKQLGQSVGVGPSRDYRLLRPAQLRRRDHLHGLGDLLRVAHRGDALADGLEARHAG